ncbi:MAG: DUF3696 domain-containing protein [Woeseiaceae bacterium]
MIKNIRIKNLRSLVDTGRIELKPLTVLVGKNSSGKSTFARTFPLLRQSIEEATKGPILWYGRLVDFGDFITSKSRFTESPNIEFSFDFEVRSERLGRYISQNDFTYYDRIYRKFSHEKTSNASERYLLSLSICMNYKDSTKISRIDLKIFGIDCRIDYDHSGNPSIFIDNVLYWEKTDDRRALNAHTNGILPKINFIKRRKMQHPEEGTVIRWVADDPFDKKLFDSIKKLVHANTSDHRINRLIHNLPLCPFESFVSEIQSIYGAPASWTNAVKGYATHKKSTVLSNIYRHVIANSLFPLMDYLNDELIKYFKNVNYIEPLRATAQRYYRGQELSVSSIDSKGANVAFYLDSLSRNEKNHFDAWVNKLFNEKIIAERQGGHIALKVKKEGNSYSTNIADIGFGVSQLLPILVQLWQASYHVQVPRRRGVSRKVKTIVIEQPELHLHPEYQAKIAEAMVSAITMSDNYNKLNVIVETHSPSIVNRIGKLVADGVISSSSVNILLFEHDEQNGSQIHEAGFDENGVLKNWPYGFFEY